MNDEPVFISLCLCALGHNIHLHTVKGCGVLTL